MAEGVTPFAIMAEGVTPFAITPFAMRTLVLATPRMIAAPAGNLGNKLQVNAAIRKLNRTL